MAQVEDIDTDMTLELEGAGVTPERFQKAVRAFFGVLGEVTKAVCEGVPPVKWRVQVKAGSSLIGVVPAPGFRPDVVSRIAAVVHDGMEKLESGRGVPEQFTGTAVRYARELSEIVSTESREEVRVRLWADRRPLVVTRQTAIGTEAAIAGHYVDHGSIEGKLQTVSERGTMRFVVYETLTDKGVNCFLGAEQADEAIRNFRRRVEVYGEITYRRDGTPVSIQVEEIVPFPELDDIPDFRAVRGILRQS